MKEKIVVGDVIYVEANTGAVKVYLLSPFFSYSHHHQSYQLSHTFILFLRVLSQFLC